jgi:UDP-N-acetylmuramoylalanine--D-glutamate ligase
MEEYAYAKRQLFRNQTVDDYAVLNASLVIPGVLAQPVTFSAMGLAADYQLIDGWLCARGEQVLEQNRTHLVGEHNAENMLAALAVADLYEIPRAITAGALCDYHPLPHRLEKVGEVDGAVYLNDSKATNIDALEKALIAMRTPVVLIAGGKDKGLDFTGLRPLLREKVRAVVLIGQMAGKMEAAWQSVVSCHRTDSLAAAVHEARLLAHHGDTVLFSPGCSSYDMFKSFEDRGDQFRALVQALAPPVS